MRAAFIAWRPQGKSRELLAAAINILEDYAKQGYHLTVRQLYYQLVAKGLIPNNIRSYHAIVNLVSQGRLAGFIDWDLIEDRVRIPSENTHWDNPRQIMEAAARSFYKSRWEEQESYVEVWCEKDAVSNIIEPVCRKWDVLFMANRGYSSQSAMYDSYKRFRIKEEQGKKLRLIYLGDHDPSGLDMTDDIRGRMGLFLYYGGDFEAVERIALNMDQIKKYNPPENPAKVTDSRYKKYVATHGKASWELDALEPSVLAGLVESAISQFVDVDKFNFVVELEKSIKDNLHKLADSVDSKGRIR